MGGGAARPSAADPPQGDGNGFRAPFFSRRVRDSMCNGKFRAAADDKFAAVHSNIFRVLGARGAGDYLDRLALPKETSHCPCIFTNHSQIGQRVPTPRDTVSSFFFSFLSSSRVYSKRARAHMFTNTEVYFKYIRVRHSSRHAFSLLVDRRQSADDANIWRIFSFVPRARAIVIGDLQ